MVTLMSGNLKGLTLRNVALKFPQFKVIAVRRPLHRGVPLEA